MRIFQFTGIFPLEFFSNQGDHGVILRTRHSSYVGKMRPFGKGTRDFVGSPKFPEREAIFAVSDHSLARNQEKKDHSVPKKSMETLRT